MKPHKSGISIKKLIRERQPRQNANQNSRPTTSSHSMTTERERRERNQERERDNDYDRSHRRRNRDQERHQGNSENTDRDLDTLGREFKRDIVRLENSVCSMNYTEKSIATEWIAKLKASEPDVEEAQARNQILSHLLKCINNGVFNVEPFNKPPPSHSLSVIRANMELTSNTPCMSTPNSQEQRKDLNELFRDSYDGGDFLSQMPVPRDGAFFIIHMRPN